MPRPRQTQSHGPSNIWGHNLLPTRRLGFRLGILDVHGAADGFGFSPDNVLGAAFTGNVKNLFHGPLHNVTKDCRITDY